MGRGGWVIHFHFPGSGGGVTVTESKLIILATQQANKSRDELLGQGIETLFRKPADQKMVN